MTSEELAAAVEGINRAVNAACGVHWSTPVLLGLSQLGLFLVFLMWWVS